MQHHFAEVNGIRMHYVTAGDLSKASRLILFAHGFPEFWYEWRRQLDEFGSASAFGLVEGRRERHLHRVARR